jgi:hypothetical protein
MCSFCGTGAGEGLAKAILVHGSSGICDKCVAVAGSTIAKEIPVKPPNKADAGKRRWSLFFWTAAEWILRVLEYGADIYSPNGWRYQEDGVKRYTEAAMRHLVAYMRGEYWDICAEHGKERPEGCKKCSGLPHLACLGCNTGFLLELDPPEAHQL